MASSPPTAAPAVASPTIEAAINNCLQHFEFSDAVNLAELYYTQTKNDVACFLLTKSLHLSGFTTYATDVIRKHGPKTPDLRYLLGKLAFEAKEYPEVEKLFVSKIKPPFRGTPPEIHPDLKGTDHEPFVYSILASVYKESNREGFSSRSYQRSIVALPLLLSNLKKYAEYGAPNIDSAMKGIDARCDARTRGSSRANSSDSSERLPEHRYMTRQRARHSQSSRVPSPREKEKAINALFSEDRAKPLSPRRSHGSPLSAINTSDDRHVAAEPMDVENHGPGKPLLADVDENQQSRGDEVYEEMQHYMHQMCHIMTHLTTFKIEEATAAFESMSEAWKKLPLSMEYLGRILCEKIEYKQAAVVFDELHARYPYHIDGMDYFSTALWQLRLGTSLSILARELTDQARHRAETWIVAGNLYSLEKQSATSIECFDRATRLYPINGYAQCLLGTELFEIGHLDRAERVFGEALIHAPHEYRPHVGLGLIEQKRARMSKAVEHLKNATRRNPLNVVLQCQLAVMYQSLRRSDGETRPVETAIEILSHAIKLNPQNQTTRFHYAKALYECKRYNEAKIELEALKHRIPTETYINKLLSRCYRKLGDKQNAKTNDVLSIREEDTVGDQPFEEEDIDVDVPAITQNQQQQQHPPQAPPLPPQQPQ
uniref:Cell division cycle protein 27 homolog n=1 Tax=Panagrellus redivivus TaxID=6233 RepID=A0A7E4VN91_PANRE